MKDVGYSMVVTASTMNIPHPTSGIQPDKIPPTFVVELTPPGRAAVAVVLVAGPDALQAVGKCFAPCSGRPAGEIPSGQIVLGRWGDGVQEELIFCRRGEEQIEIHCHGGAAAVHAVTSSLATEGCEPITWQDWSRRSSPDPIRAAARSALADAMTERTAAMLLDQLSGALAGAIRGAIVHIETANWSGAAGAIDQLLGRRNLGLHLTKPWRVVVCGPPNVGKSSLINALAGYERAIVSPSPGTTRDVVTVTTAIDGWPVQLADTAGFRATPDELEAAGMELAAAAASEADLAILVHDVARLNDESLRDEAEVAYPRFAPAARVIHVINKIDLISIAERSDLVVRLINWRSELPGAKPISALTGEGIADLVSAISRSLVPVSFPAGSAVPFTAEQLELLTASRDAVEQREALSASSLLQAMLTRSG